MASIISIVTNVSCVILCGENSLEHIACCKYSREVLAKMGITFVDMHGFLALNDGNLDPKTMANHLMALGIVYSICNTIKHHSPGLPPIVISELITAGISSAAYSFAR